MRLVSGGMQSGHVVDMDPTSVTLDRGSGAGTTKIPVNEIEYIHFEAEPLDLRNAKSQVLHGEWEKAAALLNRIKNEPTRPETLQDLQFYKALCAAKLRWLAGGDVAGGRPADAGASPRRTPAASTITRPPRRSANCWRPSGNMARGRLLRAAPLRPGPTTRCKPAWPSAARCWPRASPRKPWPLSDEVIANDADGEAAERQRVAARLAKARCWPA